MKNLIATPGPKVLFSRSEQNDPTMYISFLKQYAQQLKDGKKGIIYMGKNFIVGLLGSPDMLPMEDLIKLAKSLSTKEPKCVQKNTTTYKFSDKKKKPLKVDGVLDFMITGADYNLSKIAEDLTAWGAEEATD